AALLAVDLEGVGARLGAEGGAAPRPLRSAHGARAGAAGALLAPGLCAAARDHAARARGRRATPARRLLGAHALVHERLREARPEGLLVEGDLLARPQQRRVRHRFAPPRSRRAAPAPSRAP